MPEPYTYQGWTLYSRDVKLKRGPKVTIYFFSKRKPKSGNKMYEMPRGARSASTSARACPSCGRGNSIPSTAARDRAAFPFLPFPPYLWSSSGIVRVLA